MKRFSNSAAGFSLVEIMVALVIGMVAAIVILQMLALSEQRKRTTTSSGESQSDGVISFYQMARDVGQGGYGFTAQSLFNCNATWKVPLGGAAATAIATAVPLAPVTIKREWSVARAWLCLYLYTVCSAPWVIPPRHRSNKGE